MKRIIRLTESELVKLVRRVVNEGGPGCGERKVSGPFVSAPNKFYVYEVCDKFYIYQTNPTQKTPALLSGTQWDNTGKGYDKQVDAEAVIQNHIKGEQDTDNTNSTGMQ